MVKQARCHPDRERKGRSALCRECWNDYRRRLRKESWWLDPRNRKHHDLMYRYGITVEQYEAMVERARGECEICGEHGELVVDHDHRRKAVRGVICRKCNLMLGYARDNRVILQRAAMYLGFCELAFVQGAKHLVSS